MMKSLNKEYTSKDFSPKRQSNIELCRIISMLLIIFLHSTWTSIGFPQSGESVHPVILAFYALSIVGVDVFLFISGWFSINIKKRSLFNLFWIILFYGIVRVVFKFYDGSFSVDDILVVSKSNWFVISYIGLILISPVLNTFIEHVNSKRVWGGVILALLAYETWFSVFPARTVIEPGFHNGCSLIWFVVVYLIARYFRIYGFPNFIRKYCLMIYLLSSCLIYVFTFISIKYFPSESIPQILGKIGAQNNILVLISAISLFCCFEKLSFSSKTVNYIAKSTLAILLVHTTIIFPQMSEYYTNLVNNKEGVSLFIWWILGGISIFVFSVLLDQIRLFTQYLINIIPLWKSIK